MALVRCEGIVLKTISFPVPPPSKPSNRRQIAWPNSTPSRQIPPDALLKYTSHIGKMDAAWAALEGWVWITSWLAAPALTVKRPLLTFTRPLAEALSC